MSSVSDQHQPPFMPRWNGGSEEKRPLHDFRRLCHHSENGRVEIRIALQQERLINLPMRIFFGRYIIGVENGVEVLDLVVAARIPNQPMVVCDEKFHTTIVSIIEMGNFDIL
jgi:hypothetical protein